MPAVELLGRDSEQAALERLMERACGRPASLLLEGEAGIGKTTVWRAGIEMAREQGFGVLVCEPAPTETPLAFTGLSDLLDELPPEALELLPGPQRNALEIGLLLVDPGEEGVADPRAISLALLTLLRTLSHDEPLLVAIDDEQWLDSSSRSVVSFVLRRVRTDPIALMVTRRTDEGTVDRFPFGLNRNDELARATERRELGPLSLGAISRLISQRTGEHLPRPLLTQLFRASGGNPFFALELARSEIERGPGSGDQPLHVPERLSTLVSDRLATLPAATQETLLIASALSEPTLELVRKAGGSSLERAVQEGVIELDDDRISFAHSLLSSVLYSRASVKQRSKLHKRLASVAPSSEERARHLALGSEDPDADIAAELDAAAERAAVRGAPEAAAELFEHSARLTPDGDCDKARHRLIEAASHHFAAGDIRQARALVETLLADSQEGAWRADAIVLLADTVDDLQEALDLCRRAVEEADEDENRLTKAFLALAKVSAVIGDFSGQVAAQHEALAHARRGDDSGALMEALQGVSIVTVLTGGTIDEKLMQEAIELDSQVAGVTTFRRAPFWYGMQLYWTDQLPRASRLFHEALERATKRSELTDQMMILGPLIEVELRLGNWEAAGRMADEGLEQAHDIGQDFLIRPIAFQRLQRDVLQGETGEARLEIAKAMAQAEEVKDRWQILSLVSLTGFLELSLGHYVEAWHSLGPALELQDELERDISLGMLPLYSIRSNAIEAMIALDKFDRAESVLRGFEEHVAKTQRPNAIVTSARCRALFEASRGNLEGARYALERAIAGHELLPDPFERGRTMLVAGTIERRAKRKKDARESLQEAIAIFERLGADLWLVKAKAELERVTVSRSGEFELTPTEQRVAMLVAEGRSNKEVAAQLFMSVRTVEANLSKIYRKLGVDSRVELATRLQSGSPESP